MVEVAAPIAEAGADGAEPGFDLSGCNLLSQGAEAVSAYLKPIFRTLVSSV